MALYIYGAGGFGREVFEAAEAAGIEVSAFVQDDPTSAELFGCPIVMPTSLPSNLSAEGIVIAVADPAARRRIASGLATHGCARHWATILHPLAGVSPRAVIGPGSIVLSHAVVSTEVALGAHVHVNYGASIGHETSIGDHVTILPGARVAGRVTIDDGALVGSGSVILQGLRVGANAVVGAGAVVTRDVESGSTVVGVPAVPRPATRT